MNKINHSIKEAFMKKFSFYFLFLLILMLLISISGFASEPLETKENPEEHSREKGLNFALRGFAAALAIGICALATAFAQARIGAAGMGVIAEKPEMTGRVMLLVALPETLVILGFVISAMIIL